MGEMFFSINKHMSQTFLFLGISYMYTFTTVGLCLGSVYNGFSVMHSENFVLTFKASF